MLEKELKKSINLLNNTKKEMLEMNSSLLETNKDLTNKQIESIDLQLQSEDILEEEKERLLKEKDEVLKSLAKLEKELEEDNKNLNEIGKDLEISEENKFQSIYEVLEHFDKILTEDMEKSRFKYLTKNKKLLEDTITLNKLSEFKVLRNSTFLRKNYDSISRELQAKIAKDNKFIYPSCFQLKKSIKELITTSKPELNELEVNKLSKIYTSLIMLHLLKIDIKNEGIYIYYIMQNIYKIDCLPIDKQFEYKERLLNILENKCK